MKSIGYFLILLFGCVIPVYAQFQPPPPSYPYQPTVTVFGIPQRAGQILESTSPNNATWMDNSGSGATGPAGPSGSIGPMGPTGPAPTTGAYDYPFQFGGGSTTGKPASSETQGIVSARSAIIPGEFVGSVGNCQTTPSSSAVFTVNVAVGGGGGAPSQVGTVTVTNNVGVTDECTFTFATSSSAAVNLNEGSLLTITAPASQDATLGGVRIMIRATTTDYP